MPFATFLFTHYRTACDKQRKIKGDADIVQALRSGAASPELVRDWMLRYRLFQGIETATRITAVETFLKYAKTLKAKRSSLQSEEVRRLFQELLTAFWKQTDRGWISATSKLLWCVYPKDVVIYDSFVHRALIVLQSIDDDLKQLPKVGWQPSLKSASDIESAVEHYMRYQNMVWCLRDRSPSRDFVQTAQITR